MIVAMVLSACGAAPAAPAAPAAGGEAAAPENVVSENESQVTSGSDIVPPVVTTPCEGDACLCTGKTVSVIVNAAGPDGPISGPLYEIRDEFEAATGGTLEIIETPDSEHFPKLLTDVTSGAGAYDTSLIGAWVTLSRAATCRPSTTCMPTTATSSRSMTSTTCCPASRS
jgi:multiple sugar transport system substrate-binding protein